ncbi:hypothetical protein HCZ30_09320 [Marivivens donghaensis]|uniref:Transcription factor LuxR-like autoinducer-binding domain-containing protein n=1 Tax=Marivivens donghaensis TaxID=1699413 RepID=A0ABX0VXU6_9RHOB|nr:autoinducer binding domain-containing protein [Marivivens donghaensis]NIY72634.1 hypothetical protein [Marivivens donghaensis]
MSRKQAINSLLKRADALAEAGFSLGVQISVAPAYLFVTFPKVWADKYNKDNHVMTDPMVIWSFENEGTLRWSDAPDVGDHTVFKEAAAHGLRFGCVCSVKTGQARSICGYARGDREFTESEMAELLQITQDLHDLTAVDPKEQPAEIAEIKQLMAEYQGR